MKKVQSVFLFILFFASSVFLNAADTRPVVEGKKSFNVQYQIKRKNSKSWTTSNATLTGAVTESMMINSLAQRHHGCTVRILAVSTGKPVRCNVRYQVSRDGKSWSTGNSMLNNALTESMARNQISSRYPGMKVRILSVTKL